VNQNHWCSSILLSAIPSVSRTNPPANLHLCKMHYLVSLRVSGYGVCEADIILNNLSFPLSSLQGRVASAAIQVDAEASPSFGPGFIGVFIRLQSRFIDRSIQ
ncbi:uncharacterized protein METZ01_LOCUS343984, partial [marine metagenome]